MHTPMKACLVPDVILETHTRAEGLGDAIAATVRDVTKLRADVTLAAPGTRPTSSRALAKVRGRHLDRPGL